MRELAVLQCSLDEAALIERRDAWRAVIARALAAPAVDATSISLVLDPQDAGDVARLIALEAACCPFLTFTTSDGPGEHSVRIQAPEGGAGAIGTLASLL